GLDVVLADRHDFPRDKSCGDALIPDALAALARLGLRERVLAEALVVDTIRVHAPGGSWVDLRGRCACLPRRALDDVLRRGAEEAGARFLPRHRLESALRGAGGMVEGATLVDLDRGTERRVRARLTLLATGAAAEPLRAFGACRRLTASAIASRVYVQAPPALARELDALCLCYDRNLAPGYGWLFPGPGGVCNVGVGYFYDARPRRSGGNLRQLLSRFVETFPLAKRLISEGTLLTPLKGAPLRTALSGAALALPGLMVLGEAAGLTYSYSGEGIGKAMESGLLAAEIAAEGLRAEAPDAAALGERYAAEVARRFGARFRAYETAQAWLARPALADFLTWRARSGRFARRQLEGLINETTDPRALFSWGGLWRSLVS
ncbi:MAG TPA: geranylgeranyl reductase, partial [Vicinamibacteria bacterium]